MVQTVCRKERIQEMNLQKMYDELNISENVLAFCTKIEEDLKQRFDAIDQMAEYNQLKVLKAMQKNKVSDIHFALPLILLTDCTLPSDQ